MRFTGGVSGKAMEVELSGAPSDNTTVAAVLADFAGRGFTTELWATPGGRVRCGACDVTSPAGGFAVGPQQRLEGASDPDDMQLVVGATCPACGAQGVMSLHYGPTAGEEDADVLAAFPPEPT